MHPFQHAYLNSVRELWAKEKNPVWVWIALLSCKENGDPQPLWVVDSLAVWGERLLTRGPSIGDLGRALPALLDLRSDCAANHILKVVARMNEIEAIGIEFARHILHGRKPSDARSDTAVKFPNWSDPHIRKAVRELFEVTRAPNSNRCWRQIIVAWLYKTPGYTQRYPELPPFQLIFEEMLTMSRDRPLDRHEAA